MILYSEFGNENSGVGHIKYLTRGPQVPHPCSKWSINYDLVGR